MFALYLDCAPCRIGKQLKVISRPRKNVAQKITPHARKPIVPSIPCEEIVIPMPKGLSLEY